MYRNRNEGSRSDQPAFGPAAGRGFPLPDAASSIDVISLPPFPAKRAKWPLSFCPMRSPTVRTLSSGAPSAFPLSSASRRTLKAATPCALDGSGAKAAEYYFVHYPLGTLRVGENKRAGQTFHDGRETGA